MARNQFFPDFWRNKIPDPDFFYPKASPDRDGVNKKSSRIGYAVPQEKGIKQKSCCYQALVSRNSVAERKDTYSAVCSKSQIHVISIMKFFTKFKGDSCPHPSRSL